VLCNIVGNNAAAALMYPIAAGAAEKQGIDNVQMSYLLMLAASASFMSPFGYQTNLMVYGPGGYVFANFLKFGAPMQVVQLIVSVSVVLLDSKWWIGWIVGFGAILTIYLTRLVVPIIRKRRDAARGGSTDSRLDPIQEVL
jgi:di/tricarboxylate transporter